MIRQRRQPKTVSFRVVLEHKYRGYFIEEHNDGRNKPFVIFDDARKEIGGATTLELAEEWIDAEQAGEHDEPHE